MDLKEPIRIFSDVHLGHPASLAVAPEDFGPLIEGAATAVFNGDTVETLFRQDRPQALRMLEALRAFCLSRGVTPVLLNGNHDPEVSATNHLDLAGGAVLVTHGDLMYEDISPWSREAAVMRAAHRRELAAMDAASRASFEERLAAAKRAALALQDHDSSLPGGGPLVRLLLFVREVWPPWRPLSIVADWLKTPDLAEALAREFRPAARFMVFGHTHHGGVWKRGPRVIINTGTFMPMARRTLVELADGFIRVRKIARRGPFELGADVFKAQTSGAA